MSSQASDSLLVKTKGLPGTFPLLCRHLLRTSPWTIGPGGLCSPLRCYHGNRLCIVSFLCPEAPHFVDRKGGKPSSERWDSRRLGVGCGFGAAASPQGPMRRHCQGHWLPPQSYGRGHNSCALLLRIKVLTLPAVRAFSLGPSAQTQEDSGVPPIGQRQPDSCWPAAQMCGSSLRHSKSGKTDRTSRPRSLQTSTACFPSPSPRLGPGAGLPSQNHGRLQLPVSATHTAGGFWDGGDCWRGSRDGPFPEPALQRPPGAAVSERLILGEQMEETPLSKSGSGPWIGLTSAFFP